MPVVSNTSPIMNLAIIGKLSHLREQFGEVEQLEDAFEVIKLPYKKG